MRDLEVFLRIDTSLEPALDLRQRIKARCESLLRDQLGGTEITAEELTGSWTLLWKFLVLVGKRGAYFVIQKGYSALWERVFPAHEPGQPEPGSEPDLDPPEVPPAINPQYAVKDLISIYTYLRGLLPEETKVRLRYGLPLEETSYGVLEISMSEKSADVDIRFMRMKNIDDMRMYMGLE